MSENVYAVPDLTQKVRHGRGEREVEMEERGENEDRGEWEERTVDLYGTAEDCTAVQDNPDPAGTQQDTVGMMQENTAQPQHGDPDESKKKRSRVAAVCLGIIITLCLLLLAAVIGVVVRNMVLVKDRNNLAEELEQIQISHSNLTKFKELENKNINLTEEKKLLETKFKELEIENTILTEDKKLLETKFKELEIKNINLTEDKKLLETTFKNLIEDPALLKKLICESHGFTLDGGLCYYISTERKTWEESRQDCRDSKSDLMVIKSKDKQDFVVSLNQMVWLGLSDIEEEGHWKWVDGTPLTTKYWNKGEPNNATEKEDCAEMKGGGWNDVPCFVKKHWICERVVL